MDQNREKFLKFIWKVENFSYCWNDTNSFLKSPTFYLHIFEGSAWCLILYPRGQRFYEKYIGVYLERLSSSRGPLEIAIDFEITLLRKNGAVEYVRKMEDKSFRKGNSFGFDNLILREIILGRKKSTLLPDDILTLQCCIFPKNGMLRNNIEVIAKTHTEIERYRHQWKAIDYTSDMPLVSFDCGGNPKIIELHLWSSRQSFFHPHVLSIKFSDFTNVKALHYKIGVLDTNDSVVKLLENHIFHDRSSSGYTGHLVFPLIAVPELTKNKSLYLPSDKLSLDCEFTLCFGIQHSQIEGIGKDVTFMSVPLEETASTSETDLPPKKFLYCVDNIPSSLKNDFQKLYQEETVCDFTVKVGDKNLKVHKAVLCARSPVFKAMLTNNMKESEKNMVDISDLEEDTVQRMLIYMYTDMASDLDWETANNLYYAADKYGLNTLKRICAEVLKHNLSVSNVKDALALADMYTDEDLRKVTMEFICDHETEVMYSTEWANFLTEKVHLAAKTMLQMIRKKSENRS